MTSIASSPSPRRTSPTSAGPLPFAPTLGSSPVKQSSPMGNRRITTPLAPPPPPPLHLAANGDMCHHRGQVKYAGVDHTLGPTFSEEEDGDDSEWIASKMAALGLGSYNKSSDYTHSRAANQAAQAAQIEAMQMAQLQQQQLVQAMLASQQPSSQREALAMLQMQQAAANNPALHAHLVMQAQAQRALLAMQQGYTDPRQQQMLQQLQLAALQQQASDQRNALAAQVQANMHARTNRSRPMSPNDADLRARFESVPNTVPNKTPQLDNLRSPHPDGSWRSFSPSMRGTPKSSAEYSPAHGSRFGSRLDGPSLSAFLARRRATDESSHSGESDVSGQTDAMSKATTAQTSPNVSIFEDKPGQNILGHGRPTNVNVAPRAWTAPSQTTNTVSGFGVTRTPRAASHAGSSRTITVRQPFGPPGEANELGEKNFQSRIRRQAGLNLGMLGRRTPVATPVLA